MGFCSVAAYCRVKNFVVTSPDNNSAEIAFSKINAQTSRTPCNTVSLNGGNASGKWKVQFNGINASLSDPSLSANLDGFTVSSGAKLIVEYILS